MPKQKRSIKGRTKKEQRQHSVLSEKIAEILKSGKKGTGDKIAEIDKFLKSLPHNKFFVITLSIPRDNDILIAGSCQFLGNTEITTNLHSKKKHTILFCFKKDGKGKIEPMKDVKSKLLKAPVISSNDHIAKTLLTRINEHGSRHAAQKEYAKAA